MVQATKLTARFFGQYVSFLPQCDCDFTLPGLMPGYLSALAPGDKGESADGREAAIVEKSKHIGWVNSPLARSRNLRCKHTWRGQPLGGSLGSAPTGRGGREIFHQRAPCGCRGRCSEGRTPVTCEMGNSVTTIKYPPNSNRIKGQTGYKLVVWWLHLVLPWLGLVLLAE